MRDFKATNREQKHYIASSDIADTDTGNANSPGFKYLRIELGKSFPRRCRQEQKILLRDMRQF